MFSKTLKVFAIKTISSAKKFFVVGQVSRPCTYVHLINQ